MVIETSRFGSVQLQSDDIIRFEDGLLGFSDLHEFVVLDDPDDEIFAWLQSCKVPQVAFPILEPEFFCDNYSFELARRDLEALRATTVENLRSFAIITIPEKPQDMTANLKAPVILNIKERLGRQCVLQDNQLAIREPVFLKLQQRVVANPKHDIKSHAKDMGIAVSLRGPETGGKTPDPEASL